MSFSRRVNCQPLSIEVTLFFLPKCLYVSMYFSKKQSKLCRQWLVSPSLIAWQFQGYQLISKAAIFALRSAWLVACLCICAPLIVHLACFLVSISLERAARKCVNTKKKNHKWLFCQRKAENLCNFTTQRCYYIKVWLSFRESVDCHLNSQPATNAVIFFGFVMS